MAIECRGLGLSDAPTSGAYVLGVTVTGRIVVAFLTEL